MNSIEKLFLCFMALMAFTILSLTILTFHNLIVSFNRNQRINPEVNIKHTSPLLSLLAFVNSLIFTIPVLLIFIYTNQNNISSYFAMMLTIYFFASFCIAFFVTTAPESLTGPKEQKSISFYKTIIGWPLYAFSNITSLAKYGKTRPLFQVNT